ncbi:L-lactate permease protein [Halorhabdus tiamatea SARL4B]|uniref:L-lactate permease n=1 Tax=Halorhabdus tiamatea SARL4B TaxID=1033806 RepID=F7PMZ4_9EURY|nr:L-lactate permease [Halorhabdus tiamatea]ERJ07701.1 L-lactate permease protein [Halorhabdus tiamatea SARL4B]CCQ32641.1 L-lactate permease [Halorhabdus tiamatea SARL4B]
MANVVLLALAASLPIAVSFVLLAGLRWSAARSMAVGWVIAAALGVGVWGMESTWFAAAALKGVLGAVDIILIVFGAILLMNYLEVGGAISTIRWFFRQIESDRRVQLLLIGLGFETIIEGVAGFGTPGALAAPLFIGLGFPPLAAAVFGLFFNAPNPQFGAAGTPIIGGVDQGMSPELIGIGTEEFKMLVGQWTGVMTGLTFVFWGVLGVFLLIYWFGDDDDERTLRGAARSTAPIVPFALVLGVITGLVQWGVAWFVGYSLPDIAAGFVVIGVGIVMANAGVLVPDRTWSFPDREGWSDLWLGGLDLASISDDEPTKEMPVLLAWTPYLLVAGFLLVTRWPGLGIESQLQEFTVGFASLLGTELGWELQYLYLPGTMPFIPIALGTGLLYRLDVEGTVEAWRESVRQVAPAAMTLVIVVSLTQIMRRSAENPENIAGMMQVLSEVLANAAGGALPMVVPWIGALGTFVTGSNTVSDILFNALQYNAAENVGLSRGMIVAIQNVGGGVGNMISVQNIAAICGVVGIAGREGDILRKVAVPTVIFALFAGGVGTLLVYVVPGVF